MWINPTKIPFVTGVVTHFLGGMSHQVLSIQFGEQDSPGGFGGIQKVLGLKQEFQCRIGQKLRIAM